MPESVHSKLTRVRKPRVHITYEVETEGAVVVKDLPFVVGVMGDFSGNPTEPLKPLKERKFVSIDRDSFDEVMRRMTPGLEFRVENTLADDGSEMPVKLKFSSIEDFEPANVVEQVDPLRKLLDTRNRLRELLSAVDRADGLESELEKILQSDEQIKKLAGEMGISADKPAGGAAPGGSGPDKTPEGGAA
jgi:type VI secretion system protein ImpB